jgi:hypothetical protein
MEKGQPRPTDNADWRGMFLGQPLGRPMSKDVARSCELGFHGCEGWDVPWVIAQNRPEGCAAERRNVAGWRS